MAHVRSMPRSAGVVSAALVCALIVASAPSAAQRRGGRFWDTGRLATPESFDGGFNFCRIMFRASRYGDGGGWSVDYPRADINLSIRFSELTKAHVSFDKEGEPNHLLLRLTDETLFQCPFIMMTEVGAAFFDEAEAAALRTYLRKGGFLWADDFWGSYAWEVWTGEIGKALPPGQYPIVDLPPDHPIFRSVFEVRRVPQIPSINFWFGSGGRTSERGADSAQPHLRGIADRTGRLMVVITHNTDIGDSWEREADDPNYFYNFSPQGYALGINILVYAMSH